MTEDKKDKEIIIREGIPEIEKMLEEGMKNYPKPQPLIPKNLITVATIVMLLFLIDLILLAIWLIKGIL